LSVFTGG